MYKRKGKTSYSASNQKGIVKVVDKEIKKALKKEVEVKVAMYGMTAPYTYTTGSLYLWEAMPYFRPLTLLKGTDDSQRIGDRIRVKNIECSIEYDYQGYSGYNMQRSRLVIVQLKPNATHDQVKAQLDYSITDSNWGDSMSILTFPEMNALCYILKDIFITNRGPVLQIWNTSGTPSTETNTIPSQHNFRFNLKPRIQPVYLPTDGSEPTGQGNIYCFHFSEGIGGGEPATDATPLFKCHTKTEYTDS